MDRWEFEFKLALRAFLVTGVLFLVFSMLAQLGVRLVSGIDSVILQWGGAILLAIVMVFIGWFQFEIPFRLCPIKKGAYVVFVGLAACHAVGAIVLAKGDQPTSHKALLYALGFISLASIAHFARRKYKSADIEY